jgi:type II secretory pathway pseudopilin PulG
MNRIVKMAGITLLEVMLVLGVAALIIVLSIIYYNSAIANNEANSALEMGQAVISSADTFAAGPGGLAAATQANIQATLPNNSLNLPWNKQMTITNITSSSITINYASVPVAVCSALQARLSASNSKVLCGTCPAGIGTLSCVYTP